MIAIKKASTDTDTALCYKLRIEVFCQEQGISEDLEIDELDKSCHQWLALEAQDGCKEGLPVGVARLNFVPSSAESKEMLGKIGRVAVLRSHRKRGIAKAIILAIEEFICTEQPHVQRTFLHAQHDKAMFYSKLGYSIADPTASPFMEDGILHVKMAKSLS
ncbi:hypothetical protein DSO57_1030162 [Entomophthora muscae]|uniref:Uncharacterized protein n=1 Tax=Entomophthora muscae TaxID=34485 RepID=A0ACC2SE24_9FUNG|nr:hypothetical protein DSO57_1030162 [Entomophthora muscae]